MPAAPAAGQWGMTPEQASEFNRIAVKTEAMEDARRHGPEEPEDHGRMDPTFIWNKKQDTAGFQFLNRASRRATTTTTPTSAPRCSTSRRRPTAARAGA